MKKSDGPTPKSQKATLVKIPPVNKAEDSPDVDSENVEEDLKEAINQPTEMKKAQSVMVQQSKKLEANDDEQIDHYSEQAELEQGGKNYI